MTEQLRNDLTPQGYIRNMFAETVDGKLTVIYGDPYNNFAEAEKTLFLNWIAEDVDKAIEKYNLLTFALARIGRVHDMLNDEESRNELLSQADLEVWNTYVRPYEPITVNWDELYPIPPCEPSELMQLIYDIHERSIYGDLIEAEELLWKRFCQWREAQSRLRIPFNRRSSADLIMRAVRYEKLVALGAPEIVITEEGRCLAEEIVLYHFGKEEPVVWE